MDAKTKIILIKMLGMTGSKHDGEALVAIRKANAILIENNLSWEDLLTSSSQPSRSSYATPPSKRKSQSTASWGDVNAAARDDQHNDSDEIDKLFEAAYDNMTPRSSFYEFIESVHTFWTERGYLTTAQYQAIKRAAR